MSENKTADKLNEIIHEHLMSMDFDVYSDKCTPTERALFFRMKDVAFAFTAFKTKELQRHVEQLMVEIANVNDDFKLLKEAADEMFNSFSTGKLEIIEKSLNNYKQLTQKQNG